MIGPILLIAFSWLVLILAADLLSAYSLSYLSIVDTLIVWNLCPCQASVKEHCWWMLHIFLQWRGALQVQNWTRKRKFRMFWTSLVRLNWAAKAITPEYVIPSDRAPRAALVRPTQLEAGTWMWCEALSRRWLATLFPFVLMNIAALFSTICAT